jgi:hypothetical protein
MDYDSLSSRVGFENRKKPSKYVTECHGEG